MITKKALRLHCTVMSSISVACRQNFYVDVQKNGNVYLEIGMLVKYSNVDNVPLMNSSHAFDWSVKLDRYCNNQNVHSSINEIHVPCSSIFHSELKSPTTHIIQEIYEVQNAHEAFEADLEKALVDRINYIIVEPARLGDETARWITVGNCLHKTAVVTGLASIVTVSLWPERFTICAAPLCAISVFCTGLYTVSWNYDPCCQYQVLIDR